MWIHSKKETVRKTSFLVWSTPFTVKDKKEHKKIIGEPTTLSYNASI